MKKLGARKVKSKKKSLAEQYDEAEAKRLEKEKQDWLYRHSEKHFDFWKHMVETNGPSNEKRRRYLH